MNNLQTEYKSVVAPKLQEHFGLSNALAAPKIVKITVSVGVGKVLREPKDIEVVERTLMRITGQKPIHTKAKKSIAGFKVREGMVVGLQVTLRGKRMWDFLEKLIHVALPRVRDFRGLEQSIVGADGDCTIGIREHIAFPEIRSDEVERIHGLAVTVTTTAGTREKGLALLTALGFPFKKNT